MRSRALLALVLLVVSACSGIRVEGDCVYVRKVETTYHCQPDGTMEHYRLAPGAPEP